MPQCEILISTSLTPNAPGSYLYGNNCAPAACTPRPCISLIRNLSLLAPTYRRAHPLMLQHPKEKKITLQRIATPLNRLRKRSSLLLFRAAEKVNGLLFGRERRALALRKIQ